MYYGAIKKLDIANGPGVRVSIFVSGCRNHCHGCFNPETWNFAYGEEFTDETLNDVMEALKHPNVTGISILGGDPFEPENQACVLDICEKVKTSMPDKDIWVWTGYEFDELKELPIMRYIDVLVDGRFEESKKDLRLKWRGSSNQRVISVQESLETGEIILCSE